MNFPGHALPPSIKNKNADGLRGIACLAVALHHFIGAFLPTLLHNNYPTSFPEAAHPSLFVSIFSSPVMTLFYNGNFPVMIFFVLSGYVLAAPYYHPNNDTTRLHRRLSGRYLRLNIPIAASVLISFLVYQCHGYFNIPAATVSGSNLWLNNFFQSGLSYVTALRDMAWASLILGEGVFNPVYWSLKAEFIGSICLLLFYIIKPKGYRALFLLLAFILIYALDKQTLLFLCAILLGSLLNVISIPKKLYLPLFIIGLFFGAFQDGNPFYNTFPHLLRWHRQSFYSSIGALLITAPIVHGFGIKFFQSRPLQFLGTISFPLYLLHFIVLCSFSCWLYLVLPQHPLTLCLNLALYLLIAIGLSVVFEKYIDQPAIRLSHWVSSVFF
ncbi:MAG: acyltransferase [Chthoniobacterales bacterium]|nr:acyltransferase [Chthoniobacterales bacterium]